MRVYRLGKTKYSKDLSGEGAKLHGGRWNNVSVPCVYTAEIRALAILELTVNVNIDDIPRALSITTIEVPDDNILSVVTSTLPGDWRNSPSPSSTKDFGSMLLENNQYPIIKVPSTIIPEEFNYLLNPLHVSAKDFKIVDIHDFIYDVRIKTI